MPSFSFSRQLGGQWGVGSSGARLSALHGKTLRVKAADDLINLFATAPLGALQLTNEKWISGNCIFRKGMF